MNLNNFTIKAQEAIQQAFTITQGTGHQAVETGHLLKGIFEIGESISEYLFKKLGVNVVNFQKALNSVIDSYPKVSGGEPYLSSNANSALQKALNISKKLGDQFISIEHLLLGLLENGDGVSQMMKDSGITKRNWKWRFRN